VEEDSLLPEEKESLIQNNSCELLFERKKQDNSTAEMETTSSMGINLKKKNVLAHSKSKIPK